MKNLNAALVADRVFLSVMGPHAGEDSAAIFSRKIADVASVGSTLWVYGSHASRPDRAQASGSTYVLFLEAASKNGARPTTSADAASEFSVDKRRWQALPAGLGPVTGHFQRGAGYAFVLKNLSLCSDARIDLWQYAHGDVAVQFRLGASTLPVHRRDTSSDPFRAKSRIRRVLAVGKLDVPCAVWVR